MKFSKYLTLAAAAALLTACSSEEPLPGGSDATPDYSDVETYAMFNIALADNGGTRAATLTDGNENEYKVNNGKILIFGLPKVDGDATTITGRVEAEYITSAKLETSTIAGSNESGLDAKGANVFASFAKGTFSAENYKEFYGVVVLNAGDTWDPSRLQKFKDWAGTPKEGYTPGAGQGFIMTNAPIDSKDGAGSPQLLIPIDRTALEDKKENVTKTAATFYVQRVAAKVTLANVAGTKTFDVGETEFKATITGWKMDLTKKSANPVQNVWDSAVKNYFEATADEWFKANSRYNWAFSSVYGKDYDSSKFNSVGSSAATMQEQQYICENTNVFSHMTKAETTRMIIHAQITKGTLDEEATAPDVFKVGQQGTLYNSNTLEAKIKEIYQAKYGKDATVEFQSIVAGKTTLDKIVTIKEGTNKISKEALEVVAGGLNLYTVNDEISVYPEGKCYYMVYIKHFFYDQVEKAKTDATYKIQIQNNNPATTYTDKHTGRFAVLRNSWYEVDVKSISGIGEPDVPEPNPNVPVEQPEDPQERHMKVEINMYNWSKYTQNETL